MPDSKLKLAVLCVLFAAVLLAAVLVEGGGR